MFVYGKFINVFSLLESGWGRTQREREEKIFSHQSNIH